MITVGIIDDNIKLTDIINEHLSTQDDMEVVGIAHNGLKGLELIEQEQPDIVLLDLVMPHSDGLSLIEKLYMENVRTKILVLTAVGREDIIKKTTDLGVSYFLLKPFELGHLSNMIRTICTKKSHSLSAPKEKALKESNNNEDLELRVTDILRSFGIPANLKGYLFLREAIQMVYLDFDLINGITKAIYPQIAKKYNTTPTRVERSIRHSIEVGWNRGSIEKLDLVFGNTVNPLKGKPTNGEFIALVADYLRLRKADFSTVSPT